MAIPLVPMTIADQITAVRSIRDGYLMALLADAANPQPNYNFDGQTVDRDGWRKSTTEMVERYNKLLATIEPWEFTTVQS